MRMLCYYQLYSICQVCRPSSNEIVQFLYALHLARSGSTNQLARLCSDGRPASEIDTNVRFVG